MAQMWLECVGRSLVVVGVILYENGPSCTFQAVPLGRASTPETANLAKGEMGEDV